MALSKNTLALLEEAIIRFVGPEDTRAYGNEDRFNDFVNDPNNVGHYTANTVPSKKVKTLPRFMTEADALVAAQMKSFQNDFNETMNGFNDRFLTFMNTSTATFDTFMGNAGNAFDAFMSNSNTTFTGFMAESGNTFTKFLETNQAEHERQVADFEAATQTLMDSLRGHYLIRTYKDEWQPNTYYEQNDIVRGPDGHDWLVTFPYTSSYDFHLDVANKNLTPAGGPEKAAEHNNQAAWTATEAVAVDGVLNLPIPYYPYRKSLIFAYQGSLAYPSSAGFGKFQYDEIGNDQNTESWQIKVHFPIEVGDELFCFVAASAFTMSLEKAKAHEDTANEYMLAAEKAANDTETALSQAQAVLSLTRAAQTAAEQAVVAATAVKEEIEMMLAQGFDASLITAGIIDFERLPPNLHHTKIVDDDSERFTLTSDQVQISDEVFVKSTKKLYRVIDDTKLDSEDGYMELAVTLPSFDWSAITGKPATFPAAPHAVTHRKDSEDTLTPEDIGAAAEVHASNHATGATDPVIPAAIGAAAAKHGSQHSIAGGDPLPPQTRVATEIVIASKTTAGSNITVASYTVGQEVIFVFHNGAWCARGSQFQEVGTEGTISTTIRFTFDLEPGDTVAYSTYYMPPTTRALAMHVDF